MTKKVKESADEKFTKTTYEPRQSGYYVNETTKFSTKHKSGVTFQDINEVCDTIDNKYADASEDDFAYTVRIETITGQRYTIKGYYLDLERFDCIEDYLRGRVLDATKFEKLYAFSVTTRKRVKEVKKVSKKKSKK